MKRGEMLSNMLMIATQRHDGQFDKGGKPYILHPLAVMQMLGDDADEELQCIALGHDLIEDTFNDVPPADRLFAGQSFLRSRGFSGRVIQGISCLTKIANETKECYQLRVLSNVDSMRVKLRDLRHNSDLTRLKTLQPTEKDFERQMYYQKFYIRILNKLQELGVKP